MLRCCCKTLFRSLDRFASSRFRAVSSSGRRVTDCSRCPSVNHPPHFDLGAQYRTIQTSGILPQTARILALFFKTFGPGPNQSGLHQIGMKHRDTEGTEKTGRLRQEIIQIVSVFCFCLSHSLRALCVSVVHTRNGNSAPVLYHWSLP